LEAPALIAAVQMIIAALAFAPTCLPELRELAPQHLLRWCIVPVFFAGMLTTSFYAYEHMSLTLLTIVRTLSPMVALPLEAAFMPPDKRPGISWQVVASLLVMLGGALTYGGANFQTITWIGIAFAALNMVLAISDRLIQRRLLTQECAGFSAGVCTLINNGLGLIPTLILATASGQFSEASTPAHAASWTDARVWLLLLASGLVGIGIGWLGLECQRALSATSFIVMQNASKVFVVLAGITFFGDQVTSVAAVLGLVLSLAGSWWYGMAQMQLQATRTSATDAKAARNSTPSSKNV